MCCQKHSSLIEWTPKLAGASLTSSCPHFRVDVTDERCTESPFVPREIQSTTLGTSEPFFFFLWRARLFLLRQASVRDAMCATVLSLGETTMSDSLQITSDAAPGCDRAYVCVVFYTVCTDSPGAEHSLCDLEHISQRRMSAILTPVAVTNYQAAGESHPCLTSLEWPMVFGVILFSPKKETWTHLQCIAIVKKQIVRERQDVHWPVKYVVHIKIRPAINRLCSAVKVAEWSRCRYFELKPTRWCKCMTSWSLNSELWPPRQQIPLNSGNSASPLWSGETNTMC